MFARRSLSLVPLVSTAGTLLCLSSMAPVWAQAPPPAPPVHPLKEAAPPVITSLRQFILAQSYLPIAPAGQNAANPQITEANGNQISDTVVNETLSVAELSGLNPNAGVLWPGSLVQGRGLMSGTLSAINVARAPGKLVLSPLGSTVRGQKRTAVVNQPDAASVEDARTKLLSQGFFVPQGVSIEYHQFYSLDEALLQIGAQANYLSAEVHGQLDSSSYSKTTNLMMVFTQPYYTLAMEAPSSPTSYFAPSVGVNDLSPYANVSTRPGTMNPTMYIASVTYGRMGLLIFSSNKSYSDLKASVEASYSSLTFGASASLSVQQQNLAKQTDIKLLMLGGDSNSGTRLVTTPAEAMKAMNDWISHPLAPRDVQLGVPISYRANYLKDNSLATLSFTTQFTREQQSVIPRYTDWKIAFDTADDDKDGDTILTVQVVGPGNATIAHYNGSGGQNGAQYTYKNGSHNELKLSEDAILYARDGKATQLLIRIDPNGHDTWDFNYTLTARDTSGGPNLVKMGHLRLSQSNRQAVIR